MTIISDATALILLSKASILEIFVNRNDAVIPEKVYEEVIKGREKGRTDSILVERLVNENKLTVKTPKETTKETTKENIRKLTGLKYGELDVISLAYKTKDTILSDDKKCINSAKALNIDFITSLDVIIVLYKKKAIDKEKAIECIEILDEYGWYSEDLIKKYKEILK